MAKAKSVFMCSACGHESPGWLGKCPGCGQWNTFVEELVEKQSVQRGQAAMKVQLLKDVQSTGYERFACGIGELDRVLGGGVVPGSVTLLAGEPGVGKSTLLLQAAHQIAAKGRIVLYIAGEESASQIKLRAQRLCIGDEIYILAENNLDSMQDAITTLKPHFIVADSVQTLYRDAFSSSPGSISQVRESAAFLLRIAKASGAAVMLVGHVTKEGGLAGPRILEHMVDTVLYFEGESQHAFRILRTTKNRFGSTNEIGIFEMQEAGMVEVPNASAVLLSERTDQTPGTAVTCCMEGTRPVLVELQALVSTSSFGNPRRMATGVDYNRMVLLMAVLEKKMGFSLYNQDAYVNVVGGLRLNEPAADLGIVVSLASSYQNKPVAHSMAMVGEVGLSGEVRSVSRMESRIGECVKLGFSACILPQANIAALKHAAIRLIGVKNIGEAVQAALYTPTS